MSAYGTESQPYTMWCFGLSGEDMESIRRCAGEECLVVARDLDALHDERALLDEEPTLLWLHLNAWEAADAAHLRGAAASVPKVLVMNADPAPDDLDIFMRADAEHVLRTPLSSAGVYRILRRTLEVCSIYQDLTRMTREILLHRETLSRKDAVLRLLAGAETHFPGVSAVPEILGALRASVTPLLELRQMHTLLWRSQGERHTMLVYYDGIAPECPQAEAWRGVVLDAARRVSGHARDIALAERLFTGVQSGPRGGHLLLLPLRTGQENIGALLFLLQHEVRFSRDQNVALSLILGQASALLHLAALRDRLSPPSVVAPYGTLVAAKAAAPLRDS